MKGFVKAIIAGAVILGIGIAVLIIALGVNGWTFSPKFETEEFTATQDNTALSVNLAAGKYKIEYYNGDKIHITYPTAKGYETTITESDGKLSITNASHVGCTVSCSILPFRVPETLIQVPQNSIKDVEITVNAGTVELPDGAYENVKIKVNAGACNVGKITGCGLLDVNVNAGACNIGGASGESFALDVSAGSATIADVDCNQSQIKVSAGAANVKFVGAKADYTATVNVSAGSCNGLTTQSGGDKNITVRVSAGSCNVSFTD